MRNSRSGVTVVELLVAIAVIGVLVAILLPAVQAAREAARRIQCSNNLTQIGHGVHLYNDTFRAFPVGNYHAVFGSWMVHIMPFVEQSTFRDKFVNSGGTQTYRTGGVRYDSPLNWVVTKQQVPLFTCPSDKVSANEKIRHGVTSHNYVANYGNTTRGRLSPYGVDDLGGPNQYGGAPFIEFVARNSGNWQDYYNFITHDNLFLTAIRLSDVVDGTSNTLLFSETVQGQSGDARGLAWWGGGCHFETYLSPNSSQPDVLERFDYCVSAGNPPCIGRSPGIEETIAARSRHPNGVQVSLCDGAVRFISNTIGLSTWRSLGTARGGEARGEF